MIRGRPGRAGRSGPSAPQWTTRLCSVTEADHAVLLRAGAVMADGAWTIGIPIDADHDVLARWLPRVHGGDAAGPHGDHVPKGHPCDLAITLCPSSWKVLSEVVCLRTGACVECGDPPARSHPLWSWDDSAEVVTWLLVSVKALCRRCAICARPDEASWRWPRERRCAHVAGILGLDVEEVSASVTAHETRVSSWRGRATTMDVSLLSGYGLRLSRGWTAEEDVLRRGDEAVTLRGVIASTTRGIVHIA